MSVAEELMRVLAETGGIPSAQTRELISRLMSKKKANRRKESIKNIWNHVYR